jgi:UDP-N-acetylglucosamine 4-epimerase
MMENSYAGTRVLVTGGAGFIGSNICEYLIICGAEVVCIDNLITGHVHNIKSLLQNDRFSFIEGDIRNQELLEEAIKGCTHVCHQAALGSVPRSIEDPIATNDHNVNGTLNVFWAAKKEGIKRVVYASSSSVYGDEETLPKVEEKTGVPLSPYAVTKCISESYAKVFTELYGMEMIGLRYFNVFGRRQDPDGAYAAVIPKFVKMLIRHQSPTIHGDGEQSRDFTYIDNVIQANINAMFKAEINAAGKVFNIAYGERVTVNQMFELIRSSLMKFDLKIENVDSKFVEERPGDIKHSLADISAAKQYLKYKPEHDLNSGMEISIDWYWNNLG